MRNNKMKLMTGLLAGVVAGPALAQSNVTVYGVADTFVAFGKAGDQRFAGMNGLGGLAGNRVGFRGTEDLGNGLAAIYTLEYGLLLDSNTGLGNTRQSWVGLKNELGQLTFGYQYAPGYLIPGNYQVMGGSAGFAPRSTLSFAGGYTIVPGNGARFASSARYASPVWGGFSVQGIFGFHNQESDSDTLDKQDDDRFGLGGEYKGEKFAVGAVYHQVAAGKDVDDTREFFVGASYDFGVAKVVGTWSKKDADGNTANDNTLFSAGVIVPVGAKSSVHLGYAQLNPEGDDNNGRSLTVGYIHPLSKRTSLFAAYNQLSYGKAAPNAFAVSVAAAGETASTVLAGINHSF